MPHNRYYMTGALELGAVVTLGGSEAHHLMRVSRARVGDQVELVNGCRVLAEARVESLAKEGVVLRIVERIETLVPTQQFILAQALPRMNHLDWIIEKGTELNVAAFWLFPGLWSEKESLSDNQMARLRALTISSMKQCGRLDLPEIICKPPLLDWEPLGGTLFFGDTDEAAAYLTHDSPPLPWPSPIVLFIGPERGFTNEEIFFLRSMLHAQGVRLHPNILRAETAPLVALVQLQALAGW